MAACPVHSFANSRIASSNPNPTGLLEAPSDARSEQIHGVAPLDLLPDAVGAAWSWKTPRLSRVPLPNRTSSHLYRPCCDRCTFSGGVLVHVSRERICTFWSLIQHSWPPRCTLVRIVVATRLNSEYVGKCLARAGSFHIPLKHAPTSPCTFVGVSSSL